MPEATRPLLRQIEAMQVANAANANAWAAAERSLHDRLSAAEAHAAACGVCSLLIWSAIPCLSSISSANVPMCM